MHQLLSFSESETLKEQFDQASELLEAGLGTSTDYFESQSRYQLAEVDILTARNSIADNRQALMEIIGEPIQALSKPPDNLLKYAYSTGWYFIV